MREKEEILDSYRGQIQGLIYKYVMKIRANNEKLYGSRVAEQTDCFLRMLVDDEKRHCGTLVMVGYDMEGGTNTKMILEAAKALEMLHAYVLLTDGDTDIDAALSGLHAAEMILANLDCDAELRLKVLSIVNRTLLLRTHARGTDRVADKLAWQSLEIAVDPLHVGMVLAGAECDATDAITPFATALGQYLITNNETDRIEAEKTLKALKPEKQRWSDAASLFSVLID